MPYSSSQELPSNVTNVLPPHARDIYKEAFNNAYEEYADQEDPEDAARRVAWSAVKRTYKKGENGMWELKEGKKE